MPLVADVIYVAQWKRAPLAWPILGMVAATAGGVVGVAFLATNNPASDADAGSKLAVGAATTAGAALNLGFAIWALALPKASDTAKSSAPAWAVAPFLLPDAKGHLTGGASFSLLRL